MKNSNVAECLEEFATTINRIDELESKVAPVLAVVAERPRPAPHRYSLDHRRIQIRDQGLRLFRFF